MEKASQYHQPVRIHIIRRRDPAFCDSQDIAYRQRSSGDACRQLGLKLPAKFCQCKRGIQL